jgi:hypothetical protein
MYRMLGSRLSGVMLSVALSTASAQTNPAGHLSPLHVAGVVTDSAGRPVPLAEVRVAAGDGTRDSTLTDASGRFAFRLSSAGDAHLEVRRMGFRPYATTLALRSPGGTDSLRVTLDRVVAQLEGVDVVDAAERGGRLAGFYERQQNNHFGHFLDRAALEATHAQRPSEALRRIPGVIIVPAHGIGNLVRVRNCRPTVWLDGVRVPYAELDEVASMSDMAAVEVYSSLAGLPQQFLDRTNPCGGILVWSRSS